MAKGKKTGGRAKGTLNKATQQVHQILAHYNYNPMEGLILTALRKLPCGTCIDADRKPTGVMKVDLPEGQHARNCKAGKYDAHGADRCTCMGLVERECSSCRGTLWERINVETKLSADKEIAQYVAPKRKAIEVSGDQNNPVRQRVEIIYRDAPGPEERQ